MKYFDAEKFSAFRVGECRVYQTLTLESEIQVQQSVYSHQVSATCLRCSCNIYEWESRVYRTLTLESKIQVQCPFIVQQYSCNLHALGGLTFNGEILKVKNLMGAPSHPIQLVKRSSEQFFVFEIGHLEGPHVAFAGHNSKFK